MKVNFAPILMKKTTILFLLLTLFYSGFSQKTATVRIVAAADTLLFTLELDELSVNKTPLNELRISNYPAGKTNLNVYLTNGLKLIDYTFYLEPGVENAFSLDVRNKQIRITPLSTVSLETKLKEIPDFAVFNYTKDGAIKGSDADELEQETTDSTSIEFTYSGNKGCQRLSSKKTVSKFTETLMQENFSSRKLTLAKRFFEENCILISDLKQIVDCFAFEDHKLEIIAASANAVFDADNYKQLRNSFKLQNNLTAFDNWLNSTFNEK
jgi:sRNA-binding regulator protein Hfq